MMESIKQYLLTVTAAALFCSVLAGILDQKSAYSKIVKMISGLIMAVVMISPLISVSISDFESYIEGFRFDASSAVTDGQTAAIEEMSAIIISKTEAYILDKAASLGLQIEAEVKLNDGDPPLPSRVVLKGSVPPYQKTILQAYIADDLGIPKENQVWS